MPDAIVSPISGRTICEMITRALEWGATPTEIELILKGHSVGLACLANLVGL